MRREAFPTNGGVPDGSHGPALHEEQHDLCEVTSCTKGDDHPEESGKVLSSPADDP